jgi:3-hydroxyacyl-CoA dehydrogenase/enoyl-CoA hydratase/3-hydroxybutyryl-CoA epimerase
MNTLPSSPFKNQPERSGGGASRKTHRLHLEFTADQVAMLTFDHPDKAANIFDEATLEEFARALQALPKLGATGLVLLSAKPNVFVAGADLNALAGASSEALNRMISRGQEIFQTLADLPIPKIAAIHGACVGGGLELALACDVRLASDDAATKLGLPETQLGIIPAWGGSTRLPRLLGLPKALELILGGKLLSGSQARKLGLVDAVMPQERLRDEALRRIARPFPKRRSHWLTNNALSAALIGGLVRRRTMKETRGHYPALGEAIAVVTQGARGSVVDSLTREREAILRLRETDAAKNLLRLFHLQESAKKKRYAPSIRLSDLPEIERTAVIGAGVMGAGIAQWFSARDFPVVLRDLDPQRIAAGLSTVRKLYDEAVRKRIMPASLARRRSDLITPSADPISLRHCDLVVEAAIENLAVKQRIFADLCTRTRPDTILATNTSALLIGQIGDAPGVTHPERMIGLHFFNPVSRMKLVEVVVTERTSPEVVEQTLRFVRGIGKLPVVVRDSPGFLVNRILMPYLIGAGRLVEQGHAPSIIDEAMRDFGMPMGPLRLLDEIGLDVAQHVAATMSEAFGERFSCPAVLTEMVSAGHLGKKSGQGFYNYSLKTDGTTVIAPEPGHRLSKHEIAIMLADLMATEAQRCLDEKVAASADEIDFAMILGTGYAPFRGGPLTDAANRATHA